MQMPPENTASDSPGPEDGYQYILASASPRRRDIMRLAGLPFVVRTATESVSEITGDVEPDARKLTHRNAVTKLEALLATAHDLISLNCIVIAADTIVSLDGNCLGKPDHRNTAKRMLLALRGRGHEVVTTVAMTHSPNLQQGRVLSHSVVSQVNMRRYGDGEIEAYIATGKCFDRAGAYGVQDPEFSPAESVVGCYLNVVGLPLCAVRALAPENADSYVGTHIYATCAAHEGMSGA